MNRFQTELSSINKDFDDLLERLSQADDVHEAMTADEYAGLVDRIFHYDEEEYRR